MLTLLLLGLAVAAAGSARAAILFSEDFEGLGYENTGWIEAVGSPDPDYTAVPLHGAQSLRCNGVQIARRPFAYSTAFYMYFRVRWNSWDPFNNVIDWEDPGTATTASIFADASKLQITHGGHSQLGTTTILENTTYHIWLEWTKGTGSDGTFAMYISTDGVKPGSPEANVTNGNGNAVDRMFVGPFSDGEDVIFDEILVSDAPIGDSPDANHPPTISSISDQTISQGTATGPIA
ncbi:MAG TPA: hypothetical protein VNH84_10710, partial [Candidatus Saccharimonadales bacterium]|nr:hypothetical protein [Candidatus Saccharimonadales bacterium]